MLGRAAKPWCSHRDKALEAASAALCYEDLQFFGMRFARSLVVCSNLMVHLLPAGPCALAAQHAAQACLLHCSSSAAMLLLLSCGPRCHRQQAGSADHYGAWNSDLRTMEVVGTHGGCQPYLQVAQQQGTACCHDWAAWDCMRRH